MKLERQYRLLSRAFPRAWRHRHGDDLVGTLLDGSHEGQRVADPADAVDVVRRGLAARFVAGGPVVQILAATGVLALTVAVVRGFITPTSPAFLATSLVVVLIPGTGVVYSVSTSISAGWQRGSAAAFGCTLGIVPHLVAACLGLSGLMQAGAEVFEAVRWVGVAYLAYLGIGMIRASGSLTDVEQGDGASLRAIVRRGVLLNLLNPKLTIFFFAFLPQFLTSPPTLLDPRLLGLSAVFMAMTLAVFLVYAAFASAIRRSVLARPRVLRRIEQSLGVVLLGFAARLATADR